MTCLSVSEKNGESETLSPRLRSPGRVLENFSSFANPFVVSTFTAQKKPVGQLADRCNWLKHQTGKTCDYSCKRKQHDETTGSRCRSLSIFMCLSFTSAFFWTVEFIAGNKQHAQTVVYINILVTPIAPFIEPWHNFFSHGKKSQSVDWLIIDW